MNSPKIIDSVTNLIDAYNKGLLGGEKMPEDARPDFGDGLDHRENLFRYLTLPMALNYQRNSYALWECALKTWEDTDTSWVFDPSLVVSRSISELRDALTRYKVALQPNKQPIIWRTICETLTAGYSGSVGVFLASLDYDIGKILTYIQITNKPGFPYLSGNKIAHYWLYVLIQYTNISFINRDELSIAPDTHICKASIILGISNEDDSPLAVSQKWKTLLAGSGISSIEVHTPLWLWSRSNFEYKI
jgi:hypothetical protein